MADPSPESQAFGKTAVERGFITGDQLERALEQLSTREPQPPLRDLLVELGFITLSQGDAIERFVDSDSEPEAKSGELSDGIIGTSFGGCVIKEVVGSGGMGQTYRAHHTRLDRDVAIKILHPRLTRIGGMAERFQREARAAAKLSHPNVVSVFDFDRKGPFFYMVMQYVPGRNLKEVLEDSGPFDTRRAIWVIVRVLQGLEAAHALGIVHRDIKPANVILTEEPAEVYIADFGTVRMLNASTQENLSAFGEILGTPQYMSPEQATADEVDGRTDIYCVGMTFYELLEGRPAFTGASMVEVLEKQILAPIPQLSGYRPELDKVLAKMTAKDKDERYQTAGEAAAALRELYHKLSRTQSFKPAHRDPSRSAGPVAPSIDTQSLEAIADRLRKSQQHGMLSFEGAEEAAAAAAATAGANAETPTGSRTDALESASGKTESSTSHRDTAQILQAALSGDLEKLIEDLVQEGRAETLVPELLLFFWKNDKHEELLSLSAKLEHTLPTVPAVPFFRGLALARAKDYEGARAAFSLASTLDLSHVPAHIHLASALLKLGRPEEGERVLRKAARLNPSSVVAAVRFAEFLAGVVKNYEEAAEAYEAAVSLAPDRMDLRVKLGLIHCKLDDLEEAEAVANEIDEWTGEKTTSAPLRERIRKVRGDQAKASPGKRSRRRATAPSERLPRIDALLPFEKTDETPTRSKRATTRKYDRAAPVPATLKPRLELLRLAVAGGKWNWARDIYRQGCLEHPEASQFHLAFGQVALRLGHADQAVEAFKRTLELKPDSRKAKAGLEKAKAARTGD